ncbi:MULTISPECIES: hypothetical protein [Acidobacteriaceae]|uniref:hypothetical protein n=1 Tax=Acidobacteriaceae TaxID=204434 RepID=UPI00131E6CDC|nr:MULTISPECIES: hypothetical protein [Acidobacteriaceae]MDW5265464.1 hypothetical protein [Edaphobacter sp.]
MSNFLQRVAAAVIQPQTKLRPILGSVFAPPTLRSPKDVLPAEVEIASQTFAPHHQEPIATPSFDASDRTGRDRLSPATAHEDFSPSHSPRSLNNDPLLLPVFNSPNELRKPTQAHSFAEDLNVASEPSQPAAADRSGVPASYQPQIVVGQQPAPKLAPYQPLIAASQQAAPRLQPHESMPTSAMIRTSRAEAARRAQPVQREPDEVHIHIGRIEVAAVPQQAPRPAAAAARRSINLTDYLARNGRSG